MFWTLSVLSVTSKQTLRKQAKRSPGGVIACGFGWAGPADPGFWGKRSGLQTHIAMMESGSLRVRMIS